jgi:serine/threonine protein kinase
MTTIRLGRHVLRWDLIVAQDSSNLTEIDSDDVSQTHVTAIPARARSRTSTTTATLLDHGDVSTDTARGPLPSRIGANQLIRKIGSGGMGTVYEAQDLVLKRHVALKILNPQISEDPVCRDMFLSEARVLSALRDDHIVTIYSVGEMVDGTPFFTMELLHGQTFEGRLQDPVDLIRVVEIIRECALGLIAVHRAGLIHRDVKPENLWIEEPSGRVKLLDFGLAWSATHHLAENAEGSFTGTPLYASPEQARSEPLNLRSDLFSLGAVFYRALVGHSPFQSTDYRATLDRLKIGRVDPIHTLLPTLPHRVAKLIDGMLATNPESRPSSAQIIVDECQDILHELTPHPTKSLISTGIQSSWFQSTSAQLAKGRVSGNGSWRWIATILGTIGCVAISIMFVVNRFSTVAPPRKRSQANHSSVASSGDASLTILTKWLGFQKLIKPGDFTGWRLINSTTESRWTVEDQVFHAEAGRTDHFLLTEEEYQDFECHLEYRWLKPGGHTTILLRAKPGPNGTANGLALNIGDDEHFPDVHGRAIGALYQTGVIQHLRNSSSPNNQPIHEWNTLDITMKRQLLDVAQNQATLSGIDLDGHLDKVRDVPAVARGRGAIGLVAHWGDVEFRNILIRKISP